MASAIWSKAHSVGIGVIVIAFPLVLVGLARQGEARWAWIAAVVLMIGFLAIAGHGVTGAWRGALIDNRNVISLARLQLMLWTVLILAGLATAVLWNVAWHYDEPLNVIVPKHLWFLMGISITSLVTSPMLLKKKEDTSPDPLETAKTFDLLANQGEDPSRMNTKGQVVVNDTPSMARWSDMITGEETGNAGHVDLARVQMLFFTLIIGLAYAAGLAALFAAAADARLGELPDLDESMIALIGISHGGYLVGKAAPHSQTEK